GGGGGGEGGVWGGGGGGGGGWRLWMESRTPAPTGARGRASPESTIQAASRPAPPRSKASNTMSTKSRNSPLPARRRITADSIAAVSSLIICRISSDCSPAAEPKWWMRLVWLIPRSVATDCSVIAPGPSASSRRRADASASVRASSGVRRTRRPWVFFATCFALGTIDTTLNKDL